MGTDRNRTLTGGRTTEPQGLSTRHQELSRQVSKVSNEVGRFKSARIEITNQGQSGVFESGSGLKIMISVHDLMRALTPEIQKMVKNILLHELK